METLRLINRRRDGTRSFHVREQVQSTVKKVEGGVASQELRGELDGRLAVARANELVIGVNAGEDAAASAFLLSLGLTEIWFDVAGTFGLYRLGTLAASEVLERLSSDSRVRYAEPHFIDGSDDFAVQSDVEEAEDTEPPVDLWNLRIVTGGAAVRPNDGEGVLVAVVDGLMDPEHRWLSEAYACNPLALQFGQGLVVVDHGMGVASIVSGSRKTLQGDLLALAPASKILPIAIDVSSGGSYAERARAIHHLAQARRAGGVQAGDRYVAVDRLIVNCSWRLRSYLDLAPAAEAFAALVGSGALCVCSAGNDGGEGAHYPSDYPGVISVAALSADLERSPFSSFGDRVNFSAPGGDGPPRNTGDIYCAGNNGTYRFAFGTSFAAPHVSGVLATLWSRNPLLSSLELLALVQERHIHAITFSDPNTQGKMGVGVPVLAYAGT